MSEQYQEPTFFRNVLKQLLPPIVWKVPKALHARLRSKTRARIVSADPSKQALEPYWNEDFAKIIDTWGEGNAWHEIKFLLCQSKGNVIDIACGTGKAMTILAELSDLSIHGIDISDFLLDKAMANGVSRDRLHRGDATKLPFQDGEFNYSYSIGSLEHFTEAGIAKFLSEASRVTTVASFHQIPVSADSQDHGFVKDVQSYWHNSESWWLQKFSLYFHEVRVLPSLWKHSTLVGRWFICSNAELPGVKNNSDKMVRQTDTPKRQ